MENDEFNSIERGYDPDYDYYMHTGELREQFEDIEPKEEEEEDGYYVPSREQTSSNPPKNKMNDTCGMIVTLFIIIPLGIWGIVKTCNDDGDKQEPASPTPSRYYDDYSDMNRYIAPNVPDTVSLDQYYNNSITPHPQKDTTVVGSVESAQDNNNVGQQSSKMTRAYKKGYKRGYDDGYEDAELGNGFHEDNYDPRNSYRGSAKKDYEQGYDEGYEDGFEDNRGLMYDADEDYDGIEDERW